LIGVSRDVTQRKLAEEKLRLSEARLQAILDNSPAVIYLKDIEGRYLLVNSRFETLFHLRSGGAVGRTDHDLFSQALADEFRTNDQKVITGLVPMEFEEITAEDGEAHTYISVKFPLISAEGTAYALCGISTDISERKRAEGQLRSAYSELAQNDAVLKRTVDELRATHEELKVTELQLIQAAKLECIGTLAAGVAHEVKNPLQTMLMGLHYLSQKLSPANEGIMLALQDMREAVTRANIIVCGLLELSADTKGEMKPDDLNVSIEHALDLVRHELASAQTIVVRRLAADLPLVTMDRGKIEQVLINLFINSIHAMPHGGTLAVSSQACDWSQELASNETLFFQFLPGDTLAVVRVQDTGHGIPERALSKIFDPFFTTKSAGHGTGLGLAVVKKIVAFHSGAVEIRNALPTGVLVTLVLKT
jgi:PAS domain S-box-containing protein